MTRDQSANSFIDHSIPLWAKTLIVVQSLTILFFSYWFYQEYTFNTYFQTWLNLYIQTNQLMLLVMLTGLTTVGSVVSIYVHSHNSKASHSAGTTPSLSEEVQRVTSTGRVDPGSEEQHLIDMIRRNSNPSTATQSGSDQSMPTLQRRPDPNKP